MGSRQTVASDDDREIAAEYERGSSRQAIARRRRVSEYAVTQAIGRAGCKMRSRSSPSQSRLSLTNEQVEAARHAYWGEGKTLREAAAAVGSTSRTVRDALIRCGAGTRDFATARREYSLDQHYFDSIDAEDKAYWLGFLAADGCLHNRKIVSLKLAAKDAAHVERYRSAIRSDAPIHLVDRPSPHSGKSCPYAELSISCAPFYQALVSHGLHPRKSATLSPWEGPPSLMRHYWRGEFDGDGCIYVASGSQKRAMTLVGSNRMAEGFARFVYYNTGYKPSVAACKGVYVARVCGIVACQAVARLLYDGASVYLPRKQAIASSLLATVASPLSLSRWHQSLIRSSAPAYRACLPGHRPA